MRTMTVTRSVCLSKVPVSPIESVLNAAVRLIARLPKFSHISSFMINQLHWLPLTARIQFKVLFLVLKSRLDIAPKYLRDRIRSPLSSVSYRPLRFVVTHALFVPRVRTTMSQTRSFATLGPSLWNALPAFLPLYVLPLSLDPFLQPSPSSKRSSSLGVLALGALLNGHCRERRYINLQIHYNISTLAREARISMIDV